MCLGFISRKGTKEKRRQRREKDYSYKDMKEYLYIKKLNQQDKNIEGKDLVRMSASSDLLDIGRSFNKSSTSQYDNLSLCA